MTAIEKKCGNCIYWKEDRGMWCMNGWSGNGETGFCEYDVKVIRKNVESKCHNFTPKQ